MNKFLWKDTSSFSQSDKERVPNEFSVNTGTIKITVHRYIHCPGKWFVTCYDVRVAAKELKSEGIADAKREALETIRHSINTMSLGLDNIET